VDDFVDQAWRLALRREPDPEARERVRRGDVSPARLLRELVSSPEFERIELLDDGLARARSERARGGRPRELRAPAWSDERAIEIPWALARHAGERRVLDVGTANAEPAYVEGLRELAAELVTVDLAEPADVIADVRSLPFEDGRFDLAFCISTLEHVGRDNAVYGIEHARDDDGHEAALRELHRVLAPGGRLLVSVPTGVREDFGWHLQRAPLEWIELYERCGFVVFEDELYLHADDGWRAATLAEAEAARYGSPGPGAGALLLAELRPARLREKIRLAVRDARVPDEPRRSTQPTPAVTSTPAPACDVSTSSETTYSGRCFVSSKIRATYRPRSRVANGLDSGLAKAPRRRPYATPSTRNSVSSASL
jgi:SAM-dependent methyltransferase